MQPVIIEDLISIAGDSTNDNVIASNESLRRYLRAPFRCKGKLVAVAESADVTIDMDYGSKNVVASSQLRVSGDIQEPDDVINEDWYCEEGDQLVLRASNSNAAARTLRYRITLIPWEAEFPGDCRVMQQGPITILAGTVDQQLLDGLRYERPPVDSILEVFLSASAAGLTRTLDIDTDNISPPAVVNPSNTMPRDPFDKTIEGVEVPQDKLISLAVSATPQTDVLWKIKLWELARQ